MFRPTFDKSNLLLCGFAARAWPASHSADCVSKSTTPERKCAFGRYRSTRSLRFCPDAANARAFKVLAERWGHRAPGGKLTMASQSMEAAGSSRLRQIAHSASRKVPKSRMRSSCAEPGNVTAVGKPSILCKSPGEAGTTSSGVPIARCSRIACCRFLAAFHFLSCWQSFRRLRPCSRPMGCCLTLVTLSRSLATTSATPT